MKKFFVVALTALLATSLVAPSAYSKATPKATPPAQSNGSKPSAQPTPAADSQGQGQSQAQGQSQSSSQSSSSSSSQSSSSQSNKSPQTPSTDKGNQSDKNTPASTTQAPAKSPEVPAKASANSKLNPSLTLASRANGRAEKAPTVVSRTSSACQSTTAKAKAALALDPCSDFIVVFTPGLARADSASLLKASSAQVKREFSSVFNGAVVNGPLSKMQALANNPNVLVVEDDLEVKTTAIYGNKSWGLDRIDQRILPLDLSYNDGDKAGLNSYSYVVDTGIDASNLDFEGRVTPGYTAILDGKGSYDCNGHGTHVAGTIGSKSYGVAKQTTLVPVRVLDCFGSGSYSSVISGLDWIAANHRAGDAAVVNMSLGGPISSTLDGAIKNLIAKGVVVVVAAGNSNDNACNYSPARVTDAITVGATGLDDIRANYSNYGSCLDIFAPGTGITSTWIGASGVNTISGTSMATPHITGIVARFIALNAGLTPQQVASSLKKSATLDVVLDPGTGSLNALSYIDITPDTTTAPVDSSPTFTRVNPRGKVIGKK